jgi:hypothetical protein
MVKWLNFEVLRARLLWELPRAGAGIFIGQIIQKIISQERKGIRTFLERLLAACGGDLHARLLYFLLTGHLKRQKLTRAHVGAKTRPAV